MISSYNIKLFSAFSNIHQAKTVHIHRFHHRVKKQFIVKDADVGEPVSLYLNSAF